MNNFLETSAIRPSKSSEKRHMGAAERARINLTKVRVADRA